MGILHKSVLVAPMGAEAEGPQAPGYIGRSHIRIKEVEGIESECQQNMGHCFS